MKRVEGPLPSGFMNHDYVLTFSIKAPEKAQKLVALCKGPWQGDEVNACTWEISNALNPDQMERQILELLEEGDRAAYYYLSDSKRIFRVVLS
jgi:hypothetical protein